MIFQQTLLRGPSSPTGPLPSGPRLSSVPFFQSTWGHIPIWEICLPILREISESQDALSPSPSHFNSTFILIWVIKLMVTPQAGWARVCSLELNCFSQVPRQGSWQGWKASISSLSKKTEFCCPRAEKRQKSTWVSGQVSPYQLLCAHHLWVI